MSDWSQEGYLKALRFAAEAHHGQTVPGTELPYLMHVSLVSMEVIAALRTESVANPDVALQCALLHDVVEDTPTSVDDVRAAFGSAVADGVSALSKNSGLAKDDQLDDSLQRIRQQPKEVWMVKLADRITNLQPPPPHWRREKARRYHEEAIRIHTALKDASPALAGRLWKKIEAYRKYGE